MTRLDEVSSNKRRRLPPLNALRAFEAAARRGSFTLASVELNVTPGAVSRQVGHLEADLGVRLFRREHRRVTLTLAGQKYLAEIGPAFEHIAAATARVTATAADHVLRIKLPPTFAIRWFIPRLAGLHGANRRISVQITTSHDPVDFHTDDVDAAVHWGTAPTQKGIETHRLFGEVLVTVRSPRLPEPEGGFTPHAIAREVLLHSIQRPGDWPRWFEVCGTRDVTPDRTLVFQNSSLTYQGAIEGLGIAIGQLAFLSDELRTGRLIEAHPALASTETAYYLIYPAEKARLQRIKTLCGWILSEARETDNALAHALQHLRRDTGYRIPPRKDGATVRP